MPTSGWITRSQNPWILVLIAGIVTTLFGLFVLFRPWETLEALIFIVAVAFIISGVATALEHDERFPRTVTVVSGVLWIATGLVVLLWPDETLHVLAIVAGVGLMLRGALRAAVAWQQEVIHKTYYVVMGVVNFGFGLVLVVWPEPAFTIVAFLIGINIFIAGILEIAMSWELREITRFH
jgi:hypothetical protein